MQFHKWVKIEQFYNVRKTLKARERYHVVTGLEPFQYPTITYRGKIKLDGTNAGIRFENGSWSAQKRSSLISPENDNCGFATWCASNEPWVKSLGDALVADCTVFGEFAGKGIQKRTAISKIDRKIFAIFAIRWDADGSITFDPEQIQSFIQPHPDVFVIPWLGPAITVNYGNSLSVEEFASYLNEVVASIEACDPFVKETFDISGLGEGAVYYPINVAGARFTELMFKAKGEEHQVVKLKAPVVIDAEAVATATAFAEKFVTDARCEQGLQEVGGIADLRKTNDFFKWMGKDIKTESSAELEASGLTYKDVSKAVMEAARIWWMNKCRE